MINIKVNNGDSLLIGQDIKNSNIDIFTQDLAKSFSIPEGDFVMLLNYYRYVKDNNIKCDFVNYNGVNER